MDRKQYIKEYNKKYYQKNKERHRQYMKEYYQKNKETIKSQAMQWHKDNPDAVKKSTKKWRENNRHYNAQYQTQRRAAELNQTPAWADKELMELIYAECPDGMEVDHIEPIKGNKVRGLHTPHNMQYLTRSENARKSNKAVSGEHTYRMCDDGIARRCYI